MTIPPGLELRHTPARTEGRYSFCERWSVGFWRTESVWHIFAEGETADAAIAAAWAKRGEVPQKQLGLFGGE